MRRNARQSNEESRENRVRKAKRVTGVRRWIRVLLVLAVFLALVDQLVYRSLWLRRELLGRNDQRGLVA